MFLRLADLYAMVLREMDYEGVEDTPENRHHILTKLRDSLRDEPIQSSLRKDILSAFDGEIIRLQEEIDEDSQE